MNSRVVRRVFGFLAVLGITACSVDPFLDTVSGAPEARILTVDEGSLVSPGEPIPVSVDVDGAVGSGLVLSQTVRNAAGQVVASYRGDPKPEGSLEPVETDALEPGFYRVDLVVSDAQGLVAERTLPFFVGSEDYRVGSIAAYPLSLRPGSTGIFEARLVYPEGANPFVRWSSGGRILQEAAVSAGGGVLTWQAPDKEGVYLIKAEFFPVPPPSGFRYEFDSPLFGGIHAFVDAVYRPQDTDLGPPDRYSHLFHLSGNFVDHAAGAGPGDLRLVGSPRLVLAAGVLGYKVDEASGFELPLASFSSVSVRYLLPTQAFGKALIRQLTADGEARISLTTTPAGRYRVEAVVAGATADHDFSSNALPGDATVLHFHLSTASDVTRVRLEAGAGPAEEAILQVALPGDRPVRLLVGGEGALTAVIDELAVPKP